MPILTSGKFVIAVPQRPKATRNKAKKEIKWAIQELFFVREHVWETNRLTHRVDSWVRVYLQSVNVITRVLEQAIIWVQHLMWQQIEPFPVQDKVRRQSKKWSQSQLQPTNQSIYAASKMFTSTWRHFHPIFKLLLFFLDDASFIFLDYYIPFGVTERAMEPIPALFGQRQATWWHVGNSKLILQSLNITCT